MSTVVASVAVVCAVALTNSVALADSVGVPIKGSPVVVPSPSAAPRAVEATEPAEARVFTPVTEDPETPETPAAETVPAPAPIVVTETDTTAEVPQATAEAAVAEAEESGTWDPVRQWASRNGWSQERIDAWVHRLEDKRAAELDHPSTAPKTGADDASLSDGGGRLVASESSKTSAPADHNAERQSAKPDFGSKKDQSRDSPDRRD